MAYTTMTRKTWPHHANVDSTYFTSAAAYWRTSCWAQDPTRSHMMKGTIAGTSRWRPAIWKAVAPKTSLRDSGSHLALSTRRAGSSSGTNVQFQNPSLKTYSLNKTSNQSPSPSAISTGMSSATGYVYLLWTKGYLIIFSSLFRNSPVLEHPILPLLPTPYPSSHNYESQIFI